MGGLSQGVHLQTNEVGEEQEESAATGREAARGERKRADIGHGFDGGVGVAGPFFIESAGQWGEALLFEHFPHGRGAERNVVFFESLADFIDGVVALAQGNDQIIGGRLFGLSAWTVGQRNEEGHLW